ncbi:MAG TPA: hypothetical protein ACFYEL_09665 [Candidatus Wunengus californicus]|uniref:hypothetical protein n=1 Tax=Candidatus Wunengus californicus TaxID=3367619 RepID=UPI004024B24F
MKNMRTRYIIAGTVVGLAALAASVAGGWAIKYYTSDVRGRINATEDIKSGSSRIANYNHFFDLCASVQRDELALEAQSKQLAQTSDAPQINRIQTNIAGLEGHRAGQITQYNADARKDYTAGQFRDSSLPFQLSTDLYKEGMRTSCEAR